MFSYLSHRDPISPNSTQSLDFVIRNSQVVPSPHLNLTAPYRSHLLTRPRGESDKPLPSAFFADDPDMNPTPCLGLVVEDWSWTLWFHPYCDGYFIYCVQFTVVRKHNIAVSTTRELDGAGGKAVWPCGGLYISEFSRRVLIWRDVPAIENTTERVRCNWRWDDCKWIGRRITELCWVESTLFTKRERQTSSTSLTCRGSACWLNSSYKRRRRLVHGVVYNEDS